MISRKKIGIQTFMLPGQEHEALAIYNNSDYTIVDEVKVACPKEGIILLMLKWEDNSFN